MNFHLKLLIVLFFVAQVVLADPYNCAGTQTINPPANLSIPWYYPNTWDSSQNAPQYAANQNCTWIVNVPKGMFAYFSLKANTSQAAVLTMTDSVGYITTFQSVSMDPYYLVDPSFRVDLQASQIGTLGMIVTWHSIDPSSTIPTTTLVHQASTPLAKLGGDFDQAIVFQADTRVSLLVSPPTGLAIEMGSVLRLTQVYDGPTIDSTHVGNLYQIMVAGKNFVSSGKTLTVFSLYPGFRTGNLNIFQDYADVKNFTTYRSITCYLPNNCQTTLDASKGPAAAIRFWPTFFVKNLAMSNTNVLSVYTDYVTDAHKLADYTSATSNTNIPQKFSGMFTTFVLDTDIATIGFSTDPVDAKWTTAFLGRRGFFASPNYALNSSDQNFSDAIFASQTFDISYTVDGSSMVGDASLNVMINYNKNTVINNTYSSTNFPGGLVKSSGDYIRVKYQSNGAMSVGPYINFRFEEHKAAATHGILLALGVSIWRMLAV